MWAQDELYFMPSIGSMLAMPLMYTASNSPSSYVVENDKYVLINILGKTLSMFSG